MRIILQKDFLRSFFLKRKHFLTPAVVLKNSSKINFMFHTCLSRPCQKIREGKSFHNKSKFTGHIRITQGVYLSKTFQHFPADNRREVYHAGRLHPSDVFLPAIILVGVIRTLRSISIEVESLPEI